MPSFAIIGAGPAGLSAAERLARKAPNSRIDIIEQWPAPFGLARHGFAPDRIKEKAAVEKLGRVLALKPVTFWGNVQLGRDVDLADLRGLYDAVVVACGAGLDRRLSLPGDHLAGLWGGGAFLRWLNGDPDCFVDGPPLDRVRSVIVIGQGSVALEAARVLAASAKDLAKTDLDPDIASLLANSAIQTVHVVGRNPLHASRFKSADIAALKKLSGVQVGVDGEMLDSAEAAVDDADKEGKALLRAFRSFAAEPRDDSARSLRFHFGLRPLRFDGNESIERALFTRPERLGQNLALRAELVIAAIGADRGNAFDRLADARGLIAPGLYAAGWAKTGAQGDAEEAQEDAKIVVDRVLKDLVPRDKPGREGLARLLGSRGTHYVDLAGWERIDEAEIGQAEKPRSRRKFRDLNALLTMAAAPAAKPQGELF